MIVATRARACSSMQSTDRIGEQNWSKYFSIPDTVSLAFRPDSTSLLVMALPRWQGKREN